MRINEVASHLIRVS